MTSTDHPESDAETRESADASLARAQDLLSRWQGGAATAATRARRGASKLVRSSASAGHAAMRRSGGAALKAAPKAGKFARLLRSRTRPDVLDRDWRSFLLSVHNKVLDREFDRLFFARTAPAASLRQLHVASINRLSGSDYKPTPRRVFDWAMSAIGEDLSEFTFVDYGAGRGRVLLMAAERPFKHVVGVEFAAELQNDAIMNIQQFPRSRMTCRDVECLLEDAVRYTPPDGPAVLYFFNPFGETIFREAMDRIEQSYRAHPRRLYLVMVDPVHESMAEGNGVFRPHPLPAKERLRVSLFSPYRIAVYRSIA